MIIFVAYGVGGTEAMKDVYLEVSQGGDGNVPHYEMLHIFDEFFLYYAGAIF